MVGHRFAKILCSVVVTAIILGSCVQTNVTRISSKNYEPVDPVDVIIYATLQSIPDEYEEVAIINAEGSEAFTNEEMMYEAIREEAAKMGANGVIRGDIIDPSTGERIVAAMFGTGTTRSSEMVAIYVSDDQ